MAASRQPPVCSPVVLTEPRIPGWGGLLGACALTAASSTFDGIAVPMFSRIVTSASCEASPWVRRILCGLPGAPEISIAPSLIAIGAPSSSAFAPGGATIDTLAVLVEAVADGSGADETCWMRPVGSEIGSRVASWVLASNRTTPTTVATIAMGTIGATRSGQNGFADGGGVVPESDHRYHPLMPRTPARSRSQRRLPERSSSPAAKHSPA